MDGRSTQQVDTIVIGAGQAGLSAGYHLAKRGLPFAILDADARIGDHWRDRWDSLRLYSPARYDSLPGMRFPAPSSHWPTGREMADYLEAYAATVRPARQERDARRSRRADRRRLRRVDRGRRAPRRAPGHRRDRAVPRAATSRRSPLSSTRRSGRCTRTTTATRPSSATGAVLVVGLSHSGADIAFEAANAGHRTILSGQVTWPVADPGHRHEAGDARLAGRRVRVRTRAHDAHADGPAGCARRSARAAGRSFGSACGTWTGPASSVTTRRPSACSDGRPVLADGTVLDVANVIWATGYRPDYAFDRGADRRRGRLADREAWRQPDGAGPVLPGRPVPVRVLVDARRRRRPRRGVRRRPDRGAGSRGRRSARRMAPASGGSLTAGIAAGRSARAGRAPRARCS